MNDFDGMSKNQMEILSLEARHIRLMSEYLALRNLVFSFLNTEDVLIRGMTSQDYTKQEAADFLRKILAMMADSDPQRASKISRLNENAKNQNPPSA